MKKILYDERIVFDKFNMRVKNIIILSLIGVCMYASCGCDDTGTSAGLMLRLVSSAKSAGIAGATTAVGSDINSLDFNCAAISGINETTVAFSHTTYMFDIFYNDLKCAGKFQNSFGNWAVNMKYLTTNDTRRDACGLNEGEFRNSDFLLAAAYAREIHPIDAGIQLKYIYEKLDDSKAGALAIDAGFLYSTYRLPFDIGLSLRNFGTDLYHGDLGETLPLELRVGINRKFEYVSLSLDCARYREGSFIYNAGMESCPVKNFVFRSGYSEMNGFAVGASFIATAVRCHYSFSPMKYLSENVHRFSIELTIDRLKNKKHSSRKMLKKKAAPARNSNLNNQKSYGRDDIDDDIIVIESE
ncbi:MAG: hypothetical protein BWY26_00195 [Elusimicrobia bacterium ADurb.Bin231]|nr:MAG: hypothetical protein BWY26_00195 [Elusimicrobia bacterium ADurb.Bin231]